MIPFPFVKFFSSWGKRAFPEAAATRKNIFYFFTTSTIGSKYLCLSSFILCCVFSVCCRKGEYLTTNCKGYLGGTHSAKQNESDDEAWRGMTQFPNKPQCCPILEHIAYSGRGTHFGGMLNCISWWEAESHASILAYGPCKLYAE